MTAIPSYIDPETWAGYLEMRREIAKKVKAKPFTARAELLVVRRLMQMHNDGYDPNKALEASIVNSWLDVFPKDRYPSNPPGKIDPALAKILSDDKKAAPVPAAIREKMKEWRK